MAALFSLASSLGCLFAFVFYFLNNNHPPLGRSSAYLFSTFYDYWFFEQEKYEQKAWNDPAGAVSRPGREDLDVTARPDRGLGNDD